MEEVYEDLDGIKQTLDDYSNKFAAKKDLSDLKARLLAQIEEKPAVSEIQKVLQNQQSELANKWIHFREEVRLFRLGDLGVPADQE